MRTTGQAAHETRAEIAELLERKGHAVDNARAAVARLERAFDEQVLTRTDDLDEVLRDLHVALEQDAGQKLGGKSAEAARFITRRMLGLLEEA